MKTLNPKLKAQIKQIKRLCKKTAQVLKENKAEIEKLKEAQK